MNSPNKSSNLAANLCTIRRVFGLSLAEFSEEVGVPKTTLHSAMDRGGIMLDTAVRISDGLSIPLDTLLNGTLPFHEMRLLADFCRALNWFSALDGEDRQDALIHFGALIQLLQKAAK